MYKIVFHQTAFSHLRKNSVVHLCIVDLTILKITLFLLGLKSFDLFMTQHCNRNLFRDSEKIFSVFAVFGDNY